MIYFSLRVVGRFGLAALEGSFIFRSPLEMISPRDFLDLSMLRETTPRLLA
jgi:hypothetical protein